MRSGYVFTNFPQRNRDNSISQLKCTTFVLIDDEYGPILFDSGSFYDSETLISFLKKDFGITPDDVKWLFITHIHPDHNGSNRFFKNANIVLSKHDYTTVEKISEIALSNKNLLKYLTDNFSGYKKNFDQFNADNMQWYIKKQWSPDNNGIKLNTFFIEDNPEIPHYIKPIKTFGHTLYHYSYLLDLEPFNVLVTGDALSMRMILRENKEERFIEPHMDFDLYFNSLNEIKKFQGLIVPGHDRPFFINTLKAVRKSNFKLSEIHHLNIKKESIIN